MIYLVKYEPQSSSDPHGVARKHYYFGEKIKKKYKVYLRFLPGTWLIKCDPPFGATSILGYLQAGLGDKDGLFIMRANRDYSGKLPQEAWDWMESHIPLDKDDYSTL